MLDCKTVSSVQLQQNESRETFKGRLVRWTKCQSVRALPETRRTQQQRSADTDKGKTMCLFHCRPAENSPISASQDAWLCEAGRAECVGQM